MRDILSAGLRRLTQEEPHFTPGTRRATVLVIAAQKGGVGKTTTSVNLATALVEHHGQRVLVIDMDGQGHVGACLGVKTQPARPLSQVLLSPVKDDILHAVVETPFEGLHITAPDLGLSDAEPILSGRVGREHILSEAMSTARTHYDTILIDSPPNLGNLTLNALMAADEVIVPCDMSMLAVSGVAQLLVAVETLQDRLAHSISVLGILRTRVDTRNITLNEAVDEALLEAYPHFLLETSIPINSALAKAQAVGAPIQSFDARCTGALAYRTLSDEVIRRLAGRGRTRQQLVR